MFQKAKPIWISKKECEMNTYAVFRGDVQAGTDPLASVQLHVAGTAFYKVYADGRFVAAGPARTAKGYVREDVLDLGPCKEVLIEAVGYYCCSLSTVRQPSFVMAEILVEDRVTAYTGRDFEGFLPDQKLSCTERFSIQRHFTEVWDYRSGKSVTDEVYRTPVQVLEQEWKVLDRTAPYPLYEMIELSKAGILGTYDHDESHPYRQYRYSWKVEGIQYWGFYDWEEIPHHPHKWVQQLEQKPQERDVVLPVTLKKGQYAILDFGRIEAGFLRAQLEALEESDVVLAFSEFYLGETFQFANINMHSVLEYFLPAGDQRQTESFEPYTFRYVFVAVKEGAVRLKGAGVRTYMFDISKVEYPRLTNPVLESIYRAGVRTFAHNAVDLYTDCPSRERAGWLCDSYFTAKTEYELTGECRVEEAFLENYRLYENNGELVEGALPECYPSDVTKDGLFIPQWTMWYILEAEEYLLKRGHEDQKEAFRASIYALLDLYRRYENEDGLLERLPSWNFVEWSKANDWTWDVNYPTNFLYARVLEAIYNLYGDETCKHRGEEVRKAAVAQSFNGRYFCDHSVRNEAGELVLQADSSEACQYYAVLFSGIDLDSEQFAELKHLILHVFKPDRGDAMPEIFEINAFIGLYLRMESLLKLKEYQLLLDNMEGFFGEMEARTGTLWEYRQMNGSYDHGFASYALVVIREALAGLKDA